MRACLQAGEWLPELEYEAGDGPRRGRINKCNLVGLRGSEGDMRMYANLCMGVCIDSLGQKEQPGDKQ